MEQLTSKEKALLEIGVQLQIDECNKQLTNYDHQVRKLYEAKRETLYKLWKKIDENNTVSYEPKK